SPPPGRPVCPHRRGPVSSASCDRRTCGERAHRCHRRFFPPALEPQNPHLRGTKDSADYGTRTKAREAICVCKTPQFSHTGIMPDFLAREISSKPCPEPFSRTERYNFTHSNPRRAKIKNTALSLYSFPLGRDFRLAGDPVVHLSRADK